MIKISIYSSDLNQRKDIGKLLEQYFKDLNIEFEINYIRTKSLVLDIITAEFMSCNIMIICNGDEISYIKKNGYLFRKIRQQNIGHVEGPLDYKKIDEIMTTEEYNACPLGIYKLSTKNVLRTIDYEDIEYFKWVENKTTVYLKGNETENISESIKSIKKKLPDDFFVDCINGHILNFYNIKRIDKVNNSVIMRSGNKIYFDKRKMKSIIRWYFKIMFNLVD